MGAGKLIRTRNNQTIVVVEQDRTGVLYLYTLDGRLLNILHARKMIRRFARGWRQVGHILVDYGWLFSTPSIPWMLDHLPVYA